MTTINDQPQHLLARYADRTGCDKKIQLSEEFWSDYTGPMPMQEYTSRGGKIRLVLSEYVLPSHLPTYKDNPRLPGDGYRVPTGEDSCSQPHELWNDEEWMAARQVDVDFSNLSGDYRLPASVLPPDWDEMTRDDAPTVASQHPEIFEAHGLEWYRHAPGDLMPCDKSMCVGVIIKEGSFDALGIGGSARAFRWGDCGDDSIIGWRPADAPAKLPRPGPQPQDDVQALKARVQELEGEAARLDKHAAELQELHSDVVARYKSDVAELNQRLIERTEGMGNKIAELRGALAKSTGGQSKWRNKLQAMHRRAQRAESKLAKALKDAKKWKACAEWWRDSVHNIARKALAEEQEKPNDAQALKARVQELERENSSLRIWRDDMHTEYGKLEKWHKEARGEVARLEAFAANQSTPTLRPIAEMTAEVPEGCVRVFGNKEHTQHGMKFWGFHQVSQQDIDTHFLDIRLPAPPDPDEELRREWEKLFSHSDALKQIRESLIKEQVSISFQAFKAGRTKASV